MKRSKFPIFNFRDLGLTSCHAEGGTAVVCVFLPTSTQATPRTILTAHEWAVNTHHMMQRVVTQDDYSIVLLSLRTSGKLCCNGTFSDELQRHRWMYPFLLCSLLINSTSSSGESRSAHFCPFWTNKTYHLHLHLYCCNRA